MVRQRTLDEDKLIGWGEKIELKENEITAIGIEASNEMCQYRIVSAAH